MRALRFDDSLHLTTAEPEPMPEPGEALIALRLAGICHTDLELTRGYMGFRGKLGLLIAQVLHRTGCDLTVVARQPRPIALLRQWAIPYVEPDINGQIPLDQQMADIVVDCTGSAEGFASALDLVRPRGTIVLK